MATFDYPTSPYAIVVPVLACITIFIDIPPLIWHVKNRNLAAAGLVFWIVMTLFFDFINALIWPTDDIASWWKGFVLCDIEVKLLIASTIGVPGSLACIMKNLASVLDTNSTVLMPSSGQRRRQLAVDFCLTFGLPIVITLIHYVVQPSRYYIYAIAGCLASFDDSWPTVLLVWMWPSLISLLGVYYSVMVIIRMHKYRQEFSSILNSSSSNLTKSRFKRLFFMSSTLILIVLPVQFYVLYQNTSFPFYPFDWSAIHGPSRSDIIMVPTGGIVYYDHWIHIAVGFAVFFFFGLGKDAVNMYRTWLLKAKLGSIFPGLYRELPNARNHSTSTRAGSLTTRARMFFAKKRSSTTSLESRNNSASTYIATPTPSDPNKTFPIYGIAEDGIAIDTAPPGRTLSHMDEKSIPAPPPPARLPYIGSFVSAFRSPTASRQMAAHQVANAV